MSGLEKHSFQTTAPYTLLFEAVLYKFSSGVNAFQKQLSFCPRFHEISNDDSDAVGPGIWLCFPSDRRRVRLPLGQVQH